MCCGRCTCPYSLVPDVGRRLAAGRNRLSLSLSLSLTHTHTHTHTSLAAAAAAVNVERSFTLLSDGRRLVSASTPDS